MASYGLECYNASGDILIDGYSRMLRYVEGGNIDINISSYDGEVFNITLSQTYDDKVFVDCFFEPPLGTYTIVSDNDSFTVFVAPPKGGSGSTYDGIMYYNIFARS